MTTGRFFNGYLNKKSKTVNNGGLLKMNTTKLLTLGLLIFGLFGLSGIATATVTIADGNDNVKFVDEALTISWTGTTNPYTYVWVTNDSNPTESSTFCIGNYTTGMQTTDSSYVLNTTLNCTTAGVYYAIVNNTDASTSPNASGSMEKQFFYLNAFTVAVSPDYNTLGVFSGDNATVTISTTGPQSASSRVAATFTVATTESATPVKTSTDAASGNITYKIPVSTTAGTYNVTVTNGAANGTGKYAVRTFNIKADDRTVSTNATSVTLESLNESGSAANYTTSSGTDAVFNLTISGKSDDVWNATGNYTITVAFPKNTNTSTVAVNLTTGATTGTATITATCQNFTLSDSTTYTDYAANQNITIRNTKYNGTATSTFNVDQTVTITGWTNNASAVILNITNGSALVKNLTATPASNGTWTVDWDTSTSTLYNLGTYTILAWKNGSVNNSENATTTITLNDAIGINSTTSARNGSTLTDVVYADDTMTINGTSTRADGATITVNVTNSAGYTDSQTVTVTNGTFTAVWNTTNVQITASGTYTVKVNDSLVSASKTVTVLNNLTVNAPTTGPTGSNVTISGTSTRANGTIIYLTATDAYSFSVMPTNANATVSGGNWSYNWSTVNPNTLASLPAVTYTIKANDTISTATDTITLDTGSVSGVTAAPASIFLDDTVNITGTTSFPAGTAVGINITNCAGVSINTTTATVASDQTFLATFTPNVALPNIKANTSITNGTATLCAVANVGAISGSTTFTIKDDLALTTAASAVTGENVILTGTSSRQNNTAINITVSLPNTIYSITEATTVSGGTFTNNTYYATNTGLFGGPNLPAGTYTINATDGIVSVTKTLNIVTTGVIQITAPTEDQNIAIGTNFMIQGTSNRINGTGVNITITGQNTTKLTATVNESGVYNTTWNTTGYAAGYFYINVQHVVGGVLTDSSATVRVILTAATTTTTTTTTTLNGTTTTSTTTSTTSTTSPAGTIVINEFVSAAGVSYEWIELYNKGGVAVNLSGWTIENRAAVTNTSKRVPLSGTIPALGYKILNQSTELIYGDYTMSLSDDGDTIVLRNASAAIVDQVAYGDYNSPANTTNAPAAVFTTPRSSTGRYPNAVDTGVDSADFIIFSTPTPDASNGPTTTTTTTSSTTTTLANGTCLMPGNSAPCGEVILGEVVAAINLWSQNQFDLGDIIDLINSWANPATYPAD
jgi:hypothetical protein